MTLGVVIISLANQFKLFDKLIENSPINDTKYIFLVESNKLQESIISFGYFSLCFNDVDIDTFINIISGKLIGTFISEYIFLPMMTKKKNDEFIASCGNTLKIDEKAWTITKDNEFYFENNDDEFKEKLNQYVKTIDKQPVLINHGFDTENGKIKAKNLDKEAFAKYIISKYSIVKIEKILHYYDPKEKYYPCLTQDDYNSIIMQEVYNTSINQRKEYYTYLVVNAPNKKASPSNYILFNNGVYDLNTDKLLPFSNEYIIQNKIPHNYTREHSKKSIDIIDKFLLSISNNDIEVYTLLKQVMGYIMYRTNPLGKTFFLKGSGGNGKSTFFKLLDYVFGKGNIAYKELQDLPKEYNLISLNGKVLTICDDVENAYIEKTSVLKKLVTGEPVTARQLYTAPEEFIYTGKMLLAGNEIPKMNDKTNGMGRRLEIIPFDADFRESPDIHMEDKLFKEEVAERLIYIGIESLKTILNNKKFIECKVVEQAKKDYQVINDNIIPFIEEYRDIIESKACEVVYIHYQNFCSSIEGKPLGRYKFYSELQQKGKYKKRQLQVYEDPARPWIFEKLKT